MFLSGLLLTGTTVPAQTGTVLPAPLEEKIDLAEAIRFALEHNFAIRQVEVTTARTSQISALHSYKVSVAQLQRATGATEVEFTEPLPTTISP